MNCFERRLLLLGICLTVAGSLLSLLFWGWVVSLSFAAGGLLGGGNLVWLRASISSIVFHDPDRSRTRVLAGFFLRLLLIPLSLYVMIRFLFMDILAAVAGLTVFVCSVFIEGVLEAFGRSPK